MNYLEIAKSCGARVNWRHLHKDGWRLNSAEVNSVNLTPDQLHAYTEQVCKQMVEALERIADKRNIHFSGDARVVAEQALAAHKQMMGDLYE